MGQIAVNVKFDEQKVIQIAERHLARRTSKIVKKLFKENKFVDDIRRSLESELSYKIDKLIKEKA